MDRTARCNRSAIPESQAVRSRRTSTGDFVSYVGASESGVSISASSTAWRPLVLMRTMDGGFVVVTRRQRRWQWRPPVRGQGAGGQHSATPRDKFTTVHPRPETCIHDEWP